MLALAHDGRGFPPLLPLAAAATPAAALVVIAGVLLKGGKFGFEHKRESKHARADQAAQQQE